MGLARFSIKCIREGSIDYTSKQYPFFGAFGYIRTILAKMFMDRYFGNSTVGSNLNYIWFANFCNNFCSIPSSEQIAYVCCRIPSRNLLPWPVQTWLRNGTKMWLTLLSAEALVTHVANHIKSWWQSCLGNGFSELDVSIKPSYISLICVVDNYFTIPMPMSHTA
jgi:hypothetical protein